MDLDGRTLTKEESRKHHKTGISVEITWEERGRPRNIWRKSMENDIKSMAYIGSPWLGTS